MKPAHSLTDFDRAKAAIARQLNQSRKRLDKQYAQARLDVAIKVMQQARDIYWSKR